jgi:hypothetical protein
MALKKTKLLRSLDLQNTYIMSAEETKVVASLPRLTEIRGLFYGS